VPAGLPFSDLTEAVTEDENLNPDKKCCRDALRMAQSRELQQEVIYVIL
jgi:hypothetical protein